MIRTDVRGVKGEFRDQRRCPIVVGHMLRRCVLTLSFRVGGEVQSGAFSLSEGAFCLRQGKLMVNIIVKSR